MKPSSPLIVFLDRDGVINRDRKPYLTHASQIELLPSVGEALGRLCRAGARLFVVSNQQGVAKGFIEAEELPRMSEKIQALLAPFGASIEHFEYCPALASEGDPCRKPAPGMILKTAGAFGLTLERAVLIGDRWSDIEAGARANLRCLLVHTGETPAEMELDWKFLPEARFDDLAQAVEYLLVERDWSQDHVTP